MIRVTIALAVVIAAIPRQGFCPSGYRAEGDCCRAFHADTKKAFPKIEGKACPSGSYVSGGSCVILR